MIVEKPKPPIAGIIYGEIVYWGVLLGSLIVIVGSMLAFFGDNFVPVSYWISSIWKGETVLQTWQGVTGALPNGHWYLSRLTTGDGLSAFGISLGVFSVVPALLLSSVALFREKEWLYGALAMVGCVVVMIGVLGLAPMPK
jgi:uncharacterized membrane protein